MNRFIGIGSNTPDGSHTYTGTFLFTWIVPHKEVTSPEKPVGEEQERGFRIIVCDRAEILPMYTMIEGEWVMAYMYIYVYQHPSVVVGERKRQAVFGVVE